MEIETITILLDYMGTVLIAVMALLVHKKVSMEKHIDKKVIKEMRLEQSIGFIAILLLTISFVLKMQL
tara:strand:+ start:874 stop:1077 length:204 start_codon:yes stop_codon:yes gene_type:complete